MQNRVERTPVEVSGHCLRRPYFANRHAQQTAFSRKSGFGSTSSVRRFEGRRGRQSAEIGAKSYTIASSASDRPSIQLATAKLPEQIDAPQFATNMYQWASTLTSSGQNLPFTLPLRTKKLSNGFQISLLRINQGEPVAVGNINAEVEDEPSVGNIFFVRFYEGEGSQLINKNLPQEPQKRLKTIVDGLVDISTIMRTMKAAIKETASRSRKE